MARSKDAGEVAPCEAPHESTRGFTGRASPASSALAVDVPLRQILTKKIHAGFKAGLSQDGLALLEQKGDRRLSRGFQQRPLHRTQRTSEKYSCFFQFLQGVLVLELSLGERWCPS